MIKFDYQKLFDYEKEVSKLERLDALSAIGFGSGLALAFIGAALVEYQASFVFIAIFGIFVLVVSSICFFKTMTFPHLFNDNSKIKRLQKQEVCYLGYSLENEDIIRVSYRHIDATLHITYHLYDVMRTSNPKCIVETIEDEMAMHEISINQLYLHIVNLSLARENEIYSEKLKNLWTLIE